MPSANCQMNIEALCAAPPEALSQSTSQTPLSCPVAPPSQHPAPRPSRVAWAAARVCWACVPPLEDVDERRGTKSTATRPSRHRARPPPRPAPSPTPRPSRARPSRVAQGQWPKRAEDVSKTALGLPHQQRVQRAHCAAIKKPLMMKKPFAWVSQGALGTNLASPGLQIAYLEVK